jgi:hypothetical protein
VFNLGPQMTVLEVMVYFLYLVPTMVLFLRPIKSADIATITSPVNAVAVVGASDSSAGAPIRSK